MSTSINLAADPAKRVLVVHSFVNAAPPFTTHSIAFETELTAKMGKSVDLDEVSLDVARYATLDMDEALVEFMRKRHAKWQPDLVVPIGSPAGIFVAQYRDRLFPETTPVIYTGMDQRRLLPGALQQNAAFVGESFDLPGLVEDILQLAPATTNIAVVLGASPPERFWKEVVEREYQPFTNRVSFTFFNDLSFNQMLERAAHMPPRSFILSLLLMRDASGVTHNADEALKKMHAVANAPINGIFQHQLGLGIVGGRLYQGELEGIESARIAVRILTGESATNFSPKVIEAEGPAYDWRELRRWNIGTERLLPGSKVLFREPTPWDRYKWRIIGVVSICIAEAVLIALLLANLIKRRRAERSLAETEGRFRLAADTAPVMIWMSGPDKLCTYLNKTWVEFTGEKLEDELGNGWTRGIHPEDIAMARRTYEGAFDARQDFTMQYRLRRGDGEYSWIMDNGIPRFATNGAFLGYIGSATNITDLKQAEERWRSVVEGAPNAILVIGVDERIRLANAQAEVVFGYPRAELIGMWLETVIPNATEDGHPQRRRDEFADGIASFAAMGRQLFGRRKDRTWVPIEIGLNPIRTGEGLFALLSINDITERLEAQAKLWESEHRMTLAAEAAHLGMWVWDGPETPMWTSAQWKTIYGYAPNADLRFQALIDRVHPDDRVAVAKAVDYALKNQSSFFVQHRVVLPGGKLRWISTSGGVEERGNNGTLGLLGISIDITERKEAEEAARQVSSKLITAQEDERRRIARDLHDDLNQRLALLSVEADMLGRMEHNPEAQPLIEHIASQVRNLASEIHKLSYQLHPAKLEQLGLIAASRSLCQEQGKLWGLTIEFIHNDIPRQISRITALCIYRVVQEGLNNMGRHSGAACARVEIKRAEEEIQLVISDNGCGFDMSTVAANAGLGFVGMRERARLAGGYFSFHSAPNQGTRIEVNVPITADEPVR
ncbi:MAG TPA: PAS domain S-box protein [Candidatus Binatia bacterium]|nr:PAS domain S-box protein [Candidatus Binatia bacterium]